MNEQVITDRAEAMFLAPDEWDEKPQAGGARAAVEVLRHSPHDVVLVDTGTAEGDGAALLTELHSARPGLPVILLSGSDDGDAVRAGLAAGAAGYVLKDAGPEDLATAAQVARAGSGDMISSRAARDLSLTHEFRRRRGGPAPAPDARRTP